MTLACPHCGGEIVGLAGGTSPFPGWHPPGATADAIPTQTSRNPGALPEIAYDSRSKPSVKRKPYNQGYDPLFLEFWNTYPLKRDKRKAQMAWRNAIARANATVILQGARRYREDPNRVPQFTKYAEGWLNGDSWEDEPLPSRLKAEEPRDRAAEILRGAAAKGEVSRGSLPG